MKNQINFTDNRFLMFDMDEEANRMEANGEEVIRLTLGKSELPLCDPIIDAMEKAQKEYQKYSLVYPTGLPELRVAIAQYYKKCYGVDIESKNVIISAGTSSIFRNLFFVLVNDGDEVLLPQPYYSLYNFSAQMVGANIKYYDIDHKTQKIDFDSFSNNFSAKTKIVVVNTPGNPLGNVVSDEDLYRIDNIVNGCAYIICDEIYANVYFDQENKSVVQLKNTKSQFILTNAFSKAYRMYSKRVGYCIVPDNLIEPLTVIQHHTLLTVDPVVQYGAVEALKHDEEVKTLVDCYRKRRDYTVSKFDSFPDVKPI